jgi:hypothetical protein
MPGLGPKGLWHDRMIPVNLPGIFLLRVTLASEETLPTRLFHAKLQGWSAVSTKPPTTSQHPWRRRWRHMHLQGPDFFWSRVSVSSFFRDPSQLCTGSYMLFFRGSHMWEQYKQWTPPCTWSPVVAWRYDVPRDWLWDACHMAGVRWWSRCKGFHSEEGTHYCVRRHARNITFNL